MKDSFIFFKANGAYYFGPKAEMERLNGIEIEDAPFGSLYIWKRTGWGRLQYLGHHQYLG